MEGKKRETIFPETHQQSERKMLRKESSQKSAKKRFFYSHEYRVQKMGGENARNNFSTNSTNSACKKFEEKIVGKKCEKTFFIITQI